MGDKVTIKIEATMSKRWVDDFCSMLEYMQSCGNMGHSCVVAFYADGDGDFRPEFKFDCEHTRKSGLWKHKGELSDDCVPEVLFDAG